MTAPKASPLIPSPPIGKPMDTGFTLIEVLIAMTIFSIGMLAVASMQIASIGGNATSAGVTDATSQAVIQLEQFINGDYDTEVVSGTETVATTTQPITTYSITRTVTEDDVFDNTKTVVITVTWTDNGRQKQVTVRHVIPKII